MATAAPAPKQKSKAVRLSEEVLALLQREARAFETPDTVLRRLLKLPPAKRTA